MNSNERYYLIITYIEVYVVYGVQALYNCLYFRRLPTCEIQACETLEEVNALALQRYPYRVYTTPALQGVEPMPLPATGEYQRKDSELEQLLISEGLNGMEKLAAPGSSLQQESIQQAGSAASTPVVLGTEMPIIDVNAGICWAIDGMNMYGTALDLNALVSVMSDPKWVYPHALTFMEFNIASFAARKRYMERFYRRYDSAKECILEPHAQLEQGDLYQDTSYVERE